MCVDQPTLRSVVVVVLRGRMAFGIEDAELEDIEVKLFTCAMQSDWEEVVRICEQHPSAHKAIIPASGETILYMAVLDKEEKIVEKLVEQISPSELDALKIGNEEGDTPLHLAASIGNVQMCKCITDKDRKLVGFPNSKAETPLFLAALRGQKEAFLFLHGMCESSERHDYCRRDDGRNILHCVIDEEYFGKLFTTSDLVYIRVFSFVYCPFYCEIFLFVLYFYVSVHLIRHFCSCVVEYCRFGIPNNSSV